MLGNGYTTCYAKQDNRKKRYWVSEIDCDIVRPGSHCLSMIANYPLFGRDRALWHVSGKACHCVRAARRRAEDCPPHRQSCAARRVYQFVLTSAPEDEVDRSICQSRADRERLVRHCRVKSRAGVGEYFPQASSVAGKSRR